MQRSDNSNQAQIKPDSDIVNNFLKRIGTYLSLVKFSHTIFAMPFAFIGFFIALSENNYDFSYGFCCL
jgi:4-hydroxybenzoate polyprenyltransferase